MNTKHTLTQIRKGWKLRITQPAILCDGSMGDFLISEQRFATKAAADRVSKRAVVDLVAIGIKARGQA